MPSQNVEVFGLEEVLVSDLDPVLPPRRNIVQERIKCSHKVSTVFKVALMKLRELEDESADVITKRLARVEE